MVKLIIEDDEGKTTVVPLIRDEITIGRKEGNTIRLTERNVSRRHARLLKSNGTVFIEDTSSYNGIRVNGNRINGRVAVTEGDRIQIGDYVLGLKFEGTTKLGHEAPASAPQDAARTTELPRSGEPDEATAHIKVDDVAPPTAAPAASPAASPSTPARLVCVSTNFAGMEFSLRKQKMVLGRTDDNDVVINHRSISRHHCRIVEEHGRYTIIDLQSANGVRVNGEEYGKVELRRGDHIDLGHVRLRFVAPGEDFIFERDATVVDIAASGGGGKGVWIGLIAVVIIAVGVLVWRFVIAPPSAGTGSATTSGTSGGGVGSSGTAVGTAKAGGAGSVDMSKLVDKIRASLDSESWQTALDLCAKLTGDHKSDAKPDCDKATQEASYKKKFEKAAALATQNKRVLALKAYSEIPKSSAYADKRDKSDEYKKVRKAYLEAQLIEIEGLVSKGDCEEAKKRADVVKKLIPDDTQAAEKIKDCKPAIASAGSGSGTGDTPGTAGTAAPPTKTTRIRRRIRKRIVRRRRVVKKKPPKKAAPTQEQVAEAKKLVVVARRAYVNAQYAKAIAVARRVTKVLPREQAAWQVIGASACFLKKRGLVRTAMRNVVPAYKALIRSVCARAKFEP